MKLKRMSLRFNLERDADRRAWEYLQGLSTSKNQAVIAAVNASFAPVNAALKKAIREVIQDCLQNASFVQPPAAEPSSAISAEESALLDSLDDFLGG